MPIKQKSAFDANTEVTTEGLNEFKNEQLHKFLTLNVKEDLRRTPIEEFILHSLHDVPGTQNSEVKDSDLFITYNDLNLIKQEVSITDYIFPKAEILTDCCDLPTLKCEVEYLHEPSTSQHSQYTLDPFKQNAFKKIVKRYFSPILQKKSSSSCKRLNHLHGHFWKRWVPCEFCGHLYTDKFEYCIHYFKHYVKSNTRRLLNGKTNKASLLGTHKLYNTQGKSKKIEQQILLNKNSLIFTGDQKLHECDICLKQFKRNCDLNRHLKLHTREQHYKCNICPKQFKLEYYLENHLKIHIGKKLFLCKICSKQFKRKSDLNRHLKIHSGERPFKCNICSKQFMLKYDLSRHLKRHYDDTQCDICLKQFTSKSLLNYHFKIHTDEGPFNCKICSKEFKLKSRLNVHLKMHTGEKQFQCEICLKKFTYKFHLNDHLKIHTDKRPFECKICLKLFKRMSYLRQHLKKKNHIKKS